jgi:hypothetical protein
MTNGPLARVAESVEITSFKAVRTRTEIVEHPTTMQKSEIIWCSVP